MTQSTIQTQKDFEVLNNEIRQLKEKVRLVEHQKNKKIIQLQCQLDYEKNRAQGFQQKFKEQVLAVKNDAKIKELSDLLNAKENQILEIRASDIIKKKQLATKFQEAKYEANKVPKLQQTIKMLTQKNNSIREELQTIKEGAIQAIMEKQNIIVRLEQQLRIRQKMTQTGAYLEIKQKLDQTIELYQQQIRNHQIIIEQKKQQIIKLTQRIESDQLQYQQRLARLESQNNQMIQKNLTQTIESAKANQNSLLNNLQNLQELVTKYQNKNLDLQKANERLKRLHQNQKRKYENEIENLTKKYQQQFIKIKKQHEKQLKQKQREINELKVNQQKMQKNLNDTKKKLITFDTQKKKQRQQIRKQSNQQLQIMRSAVQEHVEDKKNLNQLANQIQQIKQLQFQNYSVSEWKQEKGNNQNNNQNLHIEQKTTEKKIDPNNEVILKKQQLNKIFEKHLEETQRLKKIVAQSEHTIQSLNNQIKNLTKEIQNKRQALLQLTTKRSSKQSSLFVQLQSLKSHTYKVESNLLTEKLKHAQQLQYQRQKYVQQRKQLTRIVLKLTQQKAAIETQLKQFTKGKPGIISPFKIVKK